VFDLLAGRTVLNATAHEEGSWYQLEQHSEDDPSSADKDAGDVLGD
jgi:hypothetical protein